MRALLLSLAVTLLIARVSLAGNESGQPQWRSWTDDIFLQASAARKLVILDLEAVWCHWCHVMDEKTYADPRVRRVLQESYVAVRVDQDSRPDLANRYEDYGWPATIIFDGQGRELAKLSGYIPAERMLPLLEAFVRDPSPGPSVVERHPVNFAGGSSLNEDLRKELESRHRAGYDDRLAGWGFHHKFLDADSVEYALTMGRLGDASEERMARQTLDAQLQLFDPIWGGVYQYSADGRWDRPHFEKIMSVQADNMRIYAQAFLQFGEPRYLEAARRIQGYLASFLTSPEGAFYTSQDADLIPGRHSEDYFQLPDRQRRARGLPRVDRHIYARENGWAISALAALYAASDDPACLSQAVRAAEWIVAERGLAGGGFRHGEDGQDGPYLGDTLAMGRAFLSLYAVSGERIWLARACQAADFIAEHFPAAGAGLATAAARGLPQAEPVLDENIAAARFASLLYAYTGKQEYRALGERAMRFLATPEIARRRRVLVAGILLAGSESGAEPPHVTVVGRKDDPRALALFQAANKYPLTFRRIDWLDSREGPLANSPFAYPPLKQAAAFACASGRCSAPAYKPEAVADLIRGFGKS